MKLSFSVGQHTRLTSRDFSFVMFIYFFLSFLSSACILATEIIKELKGLKFCALALFILEHLIPRYDKEVLMYLIMNQNHKWSGILNILAGCNNLLNQFRSLAIFVFSYV